MESSNKVTITGISGFLGAQICLHFLKHGGFAVRGTVRNKTNEAKIAPLRKAFGEHFDALELVEADLLDEKSIMAACEGSDYIVHTASPFPLENPKDEQVLIKPAVEGTLAVMKAAHATKAKKVVVTSSTASVASGTQKDSYDESDWSDLEKCDPYPKSKTLAEKAAWDFVENLPEDERFGLVTINPSFITGPNLNEAKFSSGDLVKQIMEGSMPGLPKMSLPAVDVRNVA